MGTETLRIGFATVGAAIMALVGQTVFAQNATGNLAEGRRLAELWCSSCHLVSPSQVSASTEAPPFATVAREADDEFTWLRAFLMDTHPPMPQFSLSREEIRNLIAYIASLRTP